jgi:hypothetical protein
LASEPVDVHIGPQLFDLLMIGLARYVDVDPYPPMFTSSLLALTAHPGTSSYNPIMSNRFLFNASNGAAWRGCSMMTFCSLFYKKAGELLGKIDKTALGFPEEPYRYRRNLHILFRQDLL